LDYHYDFSPRDQQREIFARQLQLANEAGLPVSLHVREAHDEALAILQRVGCPEAGVLLHCFNRDSATLRPFLELGCYVALGGPLTFKKSFDTRAAVTEVPLDRILTETDAPYMAPEPLRGTVCMPDQTLYTLRKLLDCFGYAGVEKALAAMTPRPCDVLDGTDPLPLAAPDFDALHQGLSEAAFCGRIYDNALNLLDCDMTPWQEERQ
jgi:TatD DNase family protein